MLEVLKVKMLLGLPTQVKVTFTSVGSSKVTKGSVTR